MRPRQLSLLRHAKSDWDTATGDRDRPLAAQGRRDAQRLADWLRRGPVRPRLVLCSPAVRAVQTLDVIRPSLPSDAGVTVDDVLYGASADRLRERLSSLPEDVDSALVIGHNPGLHDLAVTLAAAIGTGAYQALRRKLPTATLVVLELDSTAWADLAPGTARLAGFVQPDDAR